MSSSLSNSLRYREEWLQESVHLFRPWFKERKVEIPKKVYISCGFPKGGRGGHAIGQCWAPSMTVDGTVQMFISPVLDNPIEVLATGLHECCHAACGNECGHKGEFKRVARELGLAGKLTATYAEPGSALYEALGQVAASLGPYPHSGMVLQKKAKKPSNWVRLMSPENEEYTLVISRNSLEDHGWPNDPWGQQMVPKAK